MGITRKLCNGGLIQPTLRPGRRLVCPPSNRSESDSMPEGYDVIVIGGGLGGLTAAGLVAQAGRKTLLIERNHDVGGAASTYRAGNLVVEASLHETSDPRDPIDPKHHVLA